MCGKFTQYASWAEIVAFSQPLEKAGEKLVSTPMRMARIIRLDAAGARENVEMRWGFADRRAKDPSRPKHMHARAETADTLPTFAHAFAHARGILLVDTFNVGEELEAGKTKQWVITPRDGTPIAMAVIWEEWTNGEARLLTFVQMTTPSNELLARVTDRMPAILEPADWPVWLGEGGAAPADAKALLRTYDDEGRWDLSPQAPPPKRRPGQPSLF